MTKENDEPQECKERNGKKKPIIELHEKYSCRIRRGFQQAALAFLLQHNLGLVRQKSIKSYDILESYIDDQGGLRRTVIVLKEYHIPIAFRWFFNSREIVVLKQNFELNVQNQQLMRSSEAFTRFDKIGKCHEHSQLAPTIAHSPLPPNNVVPNAPNSCQETTSLRLEVFRKLPKRFLSSGMQFYRFRSMMNCKVFEKAVDSFRSM